MLVSLVLLCLCAGFLLLQLRPSRPRNFPPGPFSLPVLGNLLELNLQNPLNDLDRLKKRYGNVYSIFIGPRPAVILHGVKAIKEALVVKAADFAGRPQDLLVNDLTQRRGVIFVNNDSSWKEHRRFALITLKNYGMGKEMMEERIHTELRYAVETLENSVGGTLDPQIMFHRTSCNIVSHVMFGRRYEHDDDFMRVFSRYIFQNTKIANGPWAILYDAFPSIRNLPLPFQKAFRNFKDIAKIVIGMMNECKKNRVPGEPQNFAACYLEEMEKKKGESNFSEEELLIYALDLYSAGTDTTSNTLHTGFLHLLQHPCIQERCQEEIDRVLDGKERVTAEDKHSMPYMQAVIHEMQRVANVVPLSLFHCATKDTELMGYSIPKGTMVVENLTSVLSEEGQWKFPHDFNPENFLDEQGEFFKPEAFIPFSAGPRMCLGEGLARMELFLVVVTLLRRFRFSWPEDAGPPDLTPVYGITMSSRPYRMKVQLRSRQ